MIRLSQTFKFMCSPHIQSLTYKATTLSIITKRWLRGNCFEHCLV